MDLTQVVLEFSSGEAITGRLESDSLVLPPGSVKRVLGTAAKASATIRIDGVTVGSLDVINIRLQDEADGAALRRLREALSERGEGWSYEMSWDPLDTPPIMFHVIVWGPDGDEDPMSAGHGKSVAEAADKCREALERA